MKAIVPDVPNWGSETLATAINRPLGLMAKNGHRGKPDPAVKGRPSRS